MTANIVNLQSNEKGERRGGRQPGQLNRLTRLLKHATISAAELSKHSDGTLQGYLIFLSNEHPNLFANLLGRMYPVQMRVEISGVSERPQRLTGDMDLATMVREFELKLKSDYRPMPRAVIEHDEDDDETA